MKRILLISPMPPLIGGVSISTQRLYENLLKDGYDASCFNIKFNNPKYNTALGIILRFFIIPFYIAFHKKYDIIHCHVPGVYRKLYIALNKPLYKKAKLVFTIHGDISPYIHNKAFLFALKKCDKIICVQAGDSSKVPLNLRAKTIDIPPFILPISSNEKDTPKHILEFVKSAQFPIIIINGGIILTEPYYDLYGFSDAFDLYDRLKEAGIQTAFLSIINGLKFNETQNNFLTNLKLRYKNDKNVLIIDHEQFELFPLFKYCHICLRPTKTDGDSLTIREALAQNCFVIASDVSIRPKGVITYKKDNADELYKKTKEALETPKPQEINHATQGFYPQIKHEYEALFNN